jgi:hypothetical protein
MTIQDVARSEEISERQAQRYCRAPGYKGHVLRAVRVGRGFVIAESDYKSWRLESGFDFLPQPDGAESAPIGRSTAVAATADPAVPNKCADCATVLRPTYPPWPQVANPGGPITNVPHPSSGSMPHPLACEDHMREQQRKQLAKLRGYDDEA